MGNILIFAKYRLSVRVKVSPRVAGYGADPRVHEITVVHIMGDRRG